MIKRLISMLSVVLFVVTVFGLSAGVRDTCLPNSKVVAAVEVSGVEVPEIEVIEVEVPVVEVIEVEIPVLDIIVEVERPTLEEILYHTWEETTDSDFVYETYEEEINENMLAGAEEYLVESYEYDDEGNFILYWTTDYMDARLIAYADRDYRYMEANYFVEEYNDYEGDTLFFRR